MTIDERLKSLRRMHKRYLGANKKECGALLDEMERVTELDRKTLIRRMSGDLQRHPRKKQRGQVYGARVDDASRVIAETWDHITAERLTPNLVWMAERLAHLDEIAVD
jgi:hypothetical protein